MTFEVAPTQRRKSEKRTENERKKHKTRKITKFEGLLIVETIFQHNDKLSMQKLLLLLLKPAGRGSTGEARKEAEKTQKIENLDLGQNGLIETALGPSYTKTVRGIDWRGPNRSTGGFKGRKWQNKICSNFEISPVKSPDIV